MSSIKKASDLEEGSAEERSTEDSFNDHIILPKASVHAAQDESNRYIHSNDDPCSPWPFKLRGTFLSLGIIATLNGFMILGLELCNHSESCSANAWNPTIWGDKIATPWCEESSNDAFLGEHANALSNVIYLVLGEIIIACAMADAVREGSWTPILRPRGEPCPRHNNILIFPIYSVILGLSCIYLGLGSFAYHSYPSDLTATIDTSGIMYVFMIFVGYTVLMFVSLDSSDKVLIRARIIVVCLVVIGIVFVTLMKFYDIFIDIPVTDILIFSVGYMIASTSIIVAIRLLSHCGSVRDNAFHNQTIWAISFRIPFIAAIMFGVAILLQTIDQKKIGCDPNSFFQMHAIWHVLSGLSIFSMYIFIRTEFVGYRRRDGVTLTESIIGLKNWLTTSMMLSSNSLMTS